jgi:hypothetical protein
LPTVQATTASSEEVGCGGAGPVLGGALDYPFTALGLGVIVIWPEEKAAGRASEWKPMTDEPSFSDQLEAWLKVEGPKTIGDLGEVFSERSFAVTILFLMFFPALPLPTGGITHVFEAITVLLASEMVIGAKSIWLPARWRDRALGPTTTEKAMPFMLRRIRWLERFSKPRAASLFGQRWFLRILGVIFILLAVASGLAPPFSGLDTLPALGAVFVALAIILEDALALAIGLGLGVGGVVLILTVGAAIFHLIKGVF